MTVSRQDTIYSAQLHCETIISIQYILILSKLFQKGISFSFKMILVFKCKITTTRNNISYWVQCKLLAVIFKALNDLGPGYLWTTSEAWWNSLPLYLNSHSLFVENIPGGDSDYPNLLGIQDHHENSSSLGGWNIILLFPFIVKYFWTVHKHNTITTTECHI